MTAQTERSREDCLLIVASDLTKTVNKACLLASADSANLSPSDFKIYLKTRSCSNSWLAPDIQALRKRINRQMVEGFIKEKERNEIQ